MANGKWHSIYFRKDVRKIDFFPISSHETSYTFQLLQISDGMIPEDDSCMDKLNVHMASIFCLNECFRYNFSMTTTGTDSFWDYIRCHIGEDSQTL